MNLATSIRRVAVMSLIIAAGMARAETAVERGAYLVNALAACAGCHTPRSPAGPLLSGGTKFGASGIVSSNITPDRDTGLGNWSDRQIIDAIRNNARPDGSHIGPPMPQSAYRSMSDPDAAAIVAYLRSVPPVRHAVPAGQRVAASSTTVPVASVPTSASDDPVSRGRYIADALAHCTECHTPGLASAPEVARHLDEGGRAFNGSNGPVIAPGITAASLAHFSDAELVDIITHGVRPDGTKLDGPMPVKSYAGAKPVDLAALITYLRAPITPSPK